MGRHVVRCQCVLESVLSSGTERNNTACSGHFPGWRKSDYAFKNSSPLSAGEPVSSVWVIGFPGPKKASSVFICFPFLVNIVCRERGRLGAGVHLVIRTKVQQFSRGILCTLFQVKFLINGRIILGRNISIFAGTTMCSICWLVCLQFLRGTIWNCQSLGTMKEKV